MIPIALGDAGAPSATPMKLETMPTNFLLASSAVIPLLALAVMIELQHYDPPPQAPAALSWRPWSPRWALLLSFAFAAFITASGEWVCLRSLQVGHLVDGFDGASGTDAVWIAIALLSFTITAALTLRILVGPPDRR